MRALALGERARVDIAGGRPASLWAIVWRLEDERALLVEPEVAGVPESPDEVWREPLTLDGAAAAARMLAQRIEAQSPGAQDEPLFITFVEADA